MGQQRPSAPAAALPWTRRARRTLALTCVLGILVPSLEISIAVAALVSLAAFGTSLAWTRDRSLPGSLAAIQIAAGLFAVGTAIRVVEGAVAGELVYPGVADLLVLPGYLFAIWGIGRAAMARHALAKLADVVDAVAVGVAVATFSMAGSTDWVADAGSSAVETGVVTLYTISEPLLFAVIVLLLFGPGTRTTSARFLAGAGVYLATFEGLYEIGLQAGYGGVVDQFHRTLAVPMVLYAFATSDEDYPSFASPGIRSQQLRTGVYSGSLFVVSCLVVVSDAKAADIGFGALAVLTVVRLALSTDLLTRLQGLGDAQLAMAASLAASDSPDEALDAALEACRGIAPEGADLRIHRCPDGDCSHAEGIGADGDRTTVASIDGRVLLTSRTSWRPHHIAALTQILDLASFGLDAIVARADRIRAEERDTAERLDPVTGLPNLADFERRGQRSNATVVWHRIEDFSRLNDRLGKAGADALLAELAARLLSQVRTGVDGVWRGDGPSFLIVCAGPPRSVEQVAARLARVDGPFEIDGTTVSVTVTSVVVHVTEPISVGTLNHRIALTAAQPDVAPGEILLFHPEIEDAARRRYQLEDSLRGVRDPAAEGFRVHYQPILSADALEPTRLEALLRWEHPELGRVSPAEFIPAAERVGCSALLDRFVMETAVADRRRFEAARPGIEVQVNLSPVGLTPERVRNITEWTRRHCDTPPRLTIEIIESVIGDDVLDELMDALQGLVAAGVGLSVDDFGVGESNLHRVMALPVTQVKLAGLFSTDRTIPADTIARLIDTMHSMGHTVVVESVETEDQATMMRLAGADLLQGWLFSRDLPAPDLLEFLTQHQAA